MIDLQPARAILQADGGDIEFVRRDGGSVHLRLLIADASCAECVLPRAMLEPVVFDMLRRSDASITAVSIDDPREGSA
jgi:Fe-S cluster biogenesis protein NfuA